MLSISTLVENMHFLANNACCSIQFKRLPPASARRPVEFHAKARIGKRVHHTHLFLGLGLGRTPRLDLFQARIKDRITRFIALLANRIPRHVYISYTYKKLQQQQQQLFATALCINVPQHASLDVFLQIKKTHIDTCSKFLIVS